MSVKCRWPECNRTIQAPLWGCEEHWLSMPPMLRDEIWDTVILGIATTKEMEVVIFETVADYRQTKDKREPVVVYNAEHFGPRIEAALNRGALVDVGGAVIYTPEWGKLI